MGFFDKLFGGKHDAAQKFAGEKMTVMAPIDGTVIPLEQIPDETFATAMVHRWYRLLFGFWENLGSMWYSVWRRLSLLW